MGQGTLTIFSASAGAGKTHRLTGIYLANLFRSRYNYRKILAVTFTNKATAEMKSRILDNLHKLAAGDRSEYLPYLIKSTARSEDWIRAEAKELLNAILHDFSRFSVSTIDSFFQKVLRAFAREAGIHAGFSVELDHSMILSSAIDEMIAGASSDTRLKNWLISFALSNIEEEKSWHLKTDIIRLAEELFKEKFKILSISERSKLGDKKFLLEYIDKMRLIAHSFEKKLIDFGTRATVIFSEYTLSDDLFYHKGQGIPGFIRSLVSGNVKEPNSYVREIENDPPRWSTGSTSRQLESALTAGLEQVLKNALRYYDENITGYRSALCILSNIYALGILSDVLRHVHEITTSENSFLLSDAGEILNLITAEDQASFIYEKVGNRYENFMIDEFQDTSIIQWNNFKPLIDNSMAEGHDNLVVGDVKQSIYRWRNSDWRILGSLLESKPGNSRIVSQPLNTNWRSRSNIITFNNALFTAIPEQLDSNLNEDFLPGSFKMLYSGAVQADPCKNNGGYIRMEFVDPGDDQKCRDVVLGMLPGIIESVQAKGYKASDIGIIVRDGREGGLVLNTLIDYAEKYSQNESTFNFNAVSSDSLLLSNSPVIIFLISVISVVNNPGDLINRAVMLKFFLLSGENPEAERVSILRDKLADSSKTYFPEGYEDLLFRLRQMPLFEATESIIDFFGLGKNSWNVPFLNTFQDYVVNFASSKNADIQEFLEWWEETGKRKSVVLPGNQDAIRILTIHKSKGLEFKVVILPFLTWNLDHIASKQPILWVKPETQPYNELGILPVKYGTELKNTVFADYYREEKYSVYVDNINLLYVALTRARDVLYGFSVDNPRSVNTIARVLKSALNTESMPANGTEFTLCSHFDDENKVFEYGEIPVNENFLHDKKNLVTSSYSVSKTMESLKLKLHGENYFSNESQAIREKINYGKLMHEVFEGIDTPADIAGALRKLVLEGKLGDDEADEVGTRIMELISSPRVADWFAPGNTVLKEAGILLPTGVTRRPDRVIFKDGKATIIDFKFGEENPHYAMQVDQYRKLMNDMGYMNIEAFIWYVDKNKIESV